MKERNKGNKERFLGPNFQSPEIKKKKLRF